MIEYDDQGRAYFNGKRVPRTTEICALLAPRAWNVDEYSLHKGVLIHRITEWEDTGELDESSVDEQLAGYLAGYRQMKIDTGFKVMETELQFYSKRWGYCGRADKYGELFSYFSVLDIKSGAPHDADKYQSAAYLFGLKDAGFKVWRAWDLYLKPTGKYRLEEQKRPSELFNTFLVGVKLWKSAEAEEESRRIKMSATTDGAVPSVR